MKEIADNLSIAGYFVSSEDFLMHLQEGLPFKYDVVRTIINLHHLPLEIEKYMLRF